MIEACSAHNAHIYFFELGPTIGKSEKAKKITLQECLLIGL